MTYGDLIAKLREARGAERLKLDSYYSEPRDRWEAPLLEYLTAAKVDTSTEIERCTSELLFRLAVAGGLDYAPTGEVMFKRTVLDGRLVHPSAVSPRWVQDELLPSLNGSIGEHSDHELPLVVLVDDVPFLNDVAHDVRELRGALSRIGCGSLSEHLGIASGNARAEFVAAVQTHLVAEGKAKVLSTPNPVKANSFQTWERASTLMGSVVNGNLAQSVPPCWAKLFVLFQTGRMKSNGVFRFLSESEIEYRVRTGDHTWLYGQLTNALPAIGAAIAAHCKDLGEWDVCFGRKQTYRSSTEWAITREVVGCVSEARELPSDT